MLPSDAAGKLAIRIYLTACLCVSFASGQDSADHISVDVGQTIVAAGMAEREPFVIQAEQMEDRGVEVMHVDPVFGNGNAILVRRPVDDPAFHSAAGQP